MDKLCLKYDSAVTDSTVQLPVSKSIAARVLVMAALSAHAPRLSIPVDNDDIRVLTEALAKVAKSHGEKVEVDLHASGTALRLLTSCLAAQEGVDVTLTGVPRLLERPMNPLIWPLLCLGADVSKNMGMPVRIHGHRLEGGEVNVDPSVSSQFITSLLLVAPTFSKGLTLHLDGTYKTVSRPYIDMTVTLMHRFGISVNELISHKGKFWFNAGWRVEPGEYTIPDDYAVERDWSSASYFYELLAMHRAVFGTAKRIVMPHLSAPFKSLQGDSKLAFVFERLGVHTEVTPEGVVAYVDAVSEQERDEERKEQFVMDMREMPDVVPALAVALCGCQRHFELRGVANLRLKECDRIAALQHGLKLCGFCIGASEDTLFWDGTECPPDPYIQIPSFGDHRIAMAFAPMAMIFNLYLVILDCEVVAKSFPSYFFEMEKVGVEATGWMLCGEP